MIGFPASPPSLTAGTNGSFPVAIREAVNKAQTCTSLQIKIRTYNIQTHIIRHFLK